MITIKSAQEIEIIKEGGRILKQVFNEILPLVTAGISTNELDTRAEKLILKYGGLPGFKQVENYSWATCISVNDQIVHTPPSDRVLYDGDVVTIDMGVYYGGFHTDSATTLAVGKPISRQIVNFLDAGAQTLTKAIAQARVGNRVGHISREIYQEITNRGYFIIKELTGHGVGRELHEDPLIPCFLDGKIANTPRLAAGMVLAIELIYSIRQDTIINEDITGWSLITKKGSIAACFEHTVAILDHKTLVLT